MATDTVEEGVAHLGLKRQAMAEKVQDSDFTESADPAENYLSAGAKP